MNTPDFNSATGFRTKEAEFLYSAITSSTWMRVSVDAAEQKIIMDVVESDGAGGVQNVAGSISISLSFDDLTAYGGSNKEVKLREFQFKDPSTCAWKRICVLCTEPEAV